MRLASFWKWGFLELGSGLLTKQVNNQSLIPSTDVIRLTLTLKMTTARVVETSVTVNNNGPIQDYVHLDDQTQPTLMKCAVPSITPLSPNYREDVGNQFLFPFYRGERRWRLINFHSCVFDSFCHWFLIKFLKLYLVSCQFICRVFKLILVKRQKGLFCSVQVLCGTFVIRFNRLQKWDYLDFATHERYARTFGKEESNLV